MSRLQFSALLTPMQLSFTLRDVFAPYVVGHLYLNPLLLTCLVLRLVSCLGSRAYHVRSGIGDGIFDKMLRCTIRQLTTISTSQYVPMITLCAFLLAKTLSGPGLSAVISQIQQN